MKKEIPIISVAFAFFVGSAAIAQNPSVDLQVQRRDTEGRAVLESVKFDPAKTAVVVIDMWDRHWCKTYTARVGNMVPRLNATATAARKLGFQVVWAPSDVANHYRETPQRKAMTGIPSHPEPNLIAFTPPAAPEGLDCCECGPDRPCAGKGVWKQQHPGLAIAENDLIGDCNNARELFNLCSERGIDTLIYLGVASNMCVQHRSFGMLNMKRHGLRAFFISDLVQAITANGCNPKTHATDWNFTPAKGTIREQHYLEQYVAPSIESRQLLSAAGIGPVAKDKRPHIVFVIADDEYKTEQTLPVFAKEHLGETYRCTLVFAKGNEPTVRNDVPGLEALYDADLLVLSMRRRALPVPQMDLLEHYIRSGKPLLAIRVSTVPFQVDPKNRPDGNVIWRDFDQEVLGCHYNGYNSKARQTGTEVWALAEAKEHPLLRGLEMAHFHSPMWIYRVRPLVNTTQVVLKGRWSNEDPEEPVAWTNTYEGGRVFYTCLGHRDDFRIPAFNRLLTNAIEWCLEK